MLKQLTFIISYELCESALPAQVGLDGLEMASFTSVVVDSMSVAGNEENLAVYHHPAASLILFT